MLESRDKLLIVEDDEGLQQRLRSTLTDLGFVVEVTDSRAAAQNALRQGFDLVLLDLGLPDGDGLELCSELRARGDATPVVILTARDAPDELVRGLDAGADDFVAKPFRLAELAARIRAVLRRTKGEVVPSGRRCIGELWLDSAERMAGVGERILELRRREFDLLEFLISHPGRIWTRGQLLDRVWGRDFAGEDRTVDLHVARVRAHVEEDPRRPRYIQTVWGVGYRMSEPS